MKKILSIAITELQVLFFSPIAWFILIVFIIQNALTYFGAVESFAATLSDGGKVTDVTYRLFVQRGMIKSLLPSVLDTLFYYIPLLTMGIMSRELSSGSINLLYTTTVSNIQIILGKFLSIAIYGLIMVGVIFLFVVQGAWITPEYFDWGIIIVGLLGIFLLICAYGAVGLFMSSITSYQMVAMLSTLVILTFFTYIGTFGQDIDFVRNITYWLSINGRAQLFTKGVFCSEDFIYFITVIVLFLSLATLRLIIKRENIKRSMVLVKYGILFGAVILVAFVSSRPAMKFYVDATRFERHTLTKSSQDIIGQMKGKYKITTYVNLFDEFQIVSKTYPKRELYDINELMSPYTRFKPDLTLEYVYYYAPYGGTYSFYKKYMKDATIEDILAKQLKNLDISSRELLTHNEVAAIEPIVEQEDFKTIKIIESPSGKKEVIRYFTDITIVPSEAEISAAFKRMITEVYPKVAFVTGHDERSIFNDGDFSYSSFTSKYVRASLYNQGYDVVGITLDKPVSEDINVVVIADPRREYSSEELINYNKYINRGGNLVVLGEPARKDYVKNLMEPFGYKMADGILVKPRKGNRADIISQDPTADGAKVSYFLDQLLRSYWKVSTPSATYLEKIADNDFNNVVVMDADGSSGNLWSELQTRYFEEEEPQLNTELGETKIEQAPMAVALDRTMGNKTQKIMLISDADLFSNQEMASYPHSGIKADNNMFITGIFEWMSDGAAPIDMRRPDPIDNRVIITQDGAKQVKYTYMIGFPFLLLLAGVIIKVRRRAR